ncbi:MAG: HlyD family secretion protein, partial [Chloroflexota bacterium]|jgi:multidrug efflux pump subunit AcrA (membrane-fusion protein)|nr:HlyD family secretion protein [Chloroflexota bacterium]
LRAPFSGVIASIAAQPGSRIGAGQGLIVLANPGEPVLEASVLPADAARLATGQSARVQLDSGDGTTLTGTVLGVEAGPNSASKLVRMQVDWSGARPAYGSTGRADIVLQGKTDALLVPIRAVRTGDKGQSQVEVVDGDTHTLVPVTVGITNVNSAEIVSGVEAGQYVWVGA